jgi:hypothetical protein
MSTGRYSATVEEIELVCGYIRDDKSVAHYFGIEPERVAFVRRHMRKGVRYLPTGFADPKDGMGLEAQRFYEADCVGGSQLLNDKIQRLFRKWERRHGFQQGAAQILLTAGYVPERLAA